MRTKELVPIGQGCKRIPTAIKGQLTLLGGKCECHTSLYLNVCLACGEKFHTERSNTLTCSNRCRMRRSRSRHDVLFQTVMSLTA